MRIGIDVREFKKGAYTGLRTILFDFLSNIEKYSNGNVFVFFGNQNTDFADIPREGKKVCIRERNTFFWDQIKLPFMLKREKIDVFFSPYIKTPLYRGCKHVNTVCDVIPLMVPKYNGILALLEKIHFFLYAYICSRRSTLTVTLSHDAKNRICKIFRLDPGRVRVVYPAVRETLDKENGAKSREISDKYGLDSPFILYVGNFKKHKNILRLINAFGSLPGEIVDRYRLILLGGSERQCPQIEVYVSGKGLSGKVQVLPGLRNEEARVFMKKASLFVFPSLAEGFGIPPIEAMKSAVAVASSGIPPMTEVLADAAVYFDPYDSDDIADKISGLLEDTALLEHHAELGKARADMFSPENLGSNLFKLLEFSGNEKILCLSSEYPPVTGGIATQLYNLWDNFPEEKTLVLTSGGHRGAPFIKNRVTVLRRKYPLGPDIISRILRTLSVTIITFRESRYWNIRCIHCAQVLSSGIAGLLSCKIKKIPYIVYIYSADILEFSRGIITRYIMNAVIKNSKAVVANSVFTKNLICSRIKSVEGKIIVSTPVVNPSGFKKDISIAEARGKLGLPPDKKVILTVARLSRRKGHDIMLEAVGKLIKERRDILYLIVGEGPMMGKLKKSVKKMFLSEYVRFCGRVCCDKLRYYYRASDLFCMIPRYMEKEGDSEGFGIVFLEAAGWGLPVVAGASGGVNEAVIDGETGILVDPENVELIKETILKLLNDVETSRVLGQNGRNRIREEFNIDDRVKVLMSVS